MVHLDSLDSDRVAVRLGRYAAERVFATIRQDEGDRLAEAVTSLLASTTLAVGSGNFGAVGNEPLPIPLDDRGEFVAHGASVEPGRRPYAFALGRDETCSYQRCRLFCSGAIRMLLTRPKSIPTSSVMSAIV